MSDGEEDVEGAEEDLALTLTLFFSSLPESGVGVLNLSGRASQLNVRSALESLVSALATRDVISELILSFCGLDLQDAVMILQATMNCRALRVVDLSHNRIRSVQGLLPTVQSNGVTQLILTGNPCAKNEEEMGQLEAMLAAKRYIEPLALRCLRVCMITPRVEYPSWLFRWLFTDKKDWWRRLMFHRDPATRKAAEAFVLHFLRHLAPLERPSYVYPTQLPTPENLNAIGSPSVPPPTEQTAQVLQYFDFHLSMLEEARNYWRYIGEYFNVVAAFCLLGAKERLYLIRRGVLFWLLDWYMGQYSPYRPGVARARVGSSLEPANLKSFFNALSALVRSVRTPGMQTALAPTCFADDKLEEMPTTEEAAMGMMWIDEVLYSMIRQGYNNDAVGAMLEHLCWSDPARSDWTCFQVMHRFVHRVPGLGEHLPNVKAGMQRFLSIKDDLMERRARALLEGQPIDNSRQPFFFIAPSFDRNDFVPRLTLLLDLLSEDLPEFKSVACQLAVPYLTAMRTELIPSIPHAPELLAQLEVLEILCGHEDAAPAASDPPAPGADVLA